MRTFATMAALSVAAVLLLTGCPSKKPQYPNCAGDDDCEEGERCINQRCLQCGDDSHCDEGQQCVEGACVAKEGFCASNADCPEGGVCKNNQCFPCQEDRECGATGRCSDGRCLERGACNQDDDCEDDEDCVNGVCQRLGRGTGGDPTCQMETVYFGFDSFKVREEDRGSLGGNAECIQDNSERNVMLVGHTDPRGTEEYNIALSEKRAQAVADYLARLGIDPARFRVIPKGKAEAIGMDEASWLRDRKVEFEWQ
jgi:peptidoglycan-associated lipoprotein